MSYNDLSVDHHQPQFPRECRSSRSVFLFAVNVCLVGLMLQAEPVAQDRITLTDEQWETGFQAFAQVLRKNGIQVVANHERLKQYPQGESILILMGGVAPEDEAFVGRFVQNGGSALIATDANFGPVRIARQVVEIAGGGAINARNSQDRYQKNPGWPIVRDLEKNNSLFDGVGQIVPNLPAHLSITPRMSAADGWKMVAKYPRLFNYGYDQPFIVQYQNQSGGQLLIVPDHSIYVNGAVVVDDNLRFMLNTADWLKAGGRTKCLFVLDQEPVVPYNVSNISLYRPPPSSAETREALDALWRNTSTFDKLELANEAMEFAQEENLLEQLVDSIKVEDVVTPNRYLAILLFLGAWCIIIPFIVLLVSNRKKPLSDSTIDGLQPNEKWEKKRKEKLERFRASEALFVHFFDRTGLPVSRPADVDPGKVAIPSSPAETKQIRKQIRRLQSDFKRQSLDFWTGVKVEEVGRYIAHWTNLYETGVLRVENGQDGLG